MIILYLLHYNILNTALYLIDDFEADVSVVIVNNLSGENVRQIILQIIQS